MSEGKDPSINQVQTFRLEESSSQKALLVLILEGKFPDLRDRVHLERPVATGCLVIPNVIEIDGGRLHWDIDDDRPIEQPEPGQGMLNEFLTLQDADDEQIGAYARRWGILGVCHHGVPASHAAFANAVERPCRLLREETDLYAWEPLERWRYFSRQAWRNPEPRGPPACCLGA